MSKTKNQIVKLWGTLKTDEQAGAPPNFEVITQITNFFAVGTYFFYVMDFTAFAMRFVHPNVENILGVKVEDFNLAVYLNYVHESELELVKLKEKCAAEFILGYKPEKVLDYKVSYNILIRKKDGTYFRNLHQSTTISTSEKVIGNVLCTETDISHLGNPSPYTISFIDLKGNNSYLNLDVRDFKLEKPQAKPHLTEQELLITQLISYGLGNKAIAERLSISPLTIKTHRQNILKKTGYKNMTQAVAELLREGVI